MVLNEYRRYGILGKEVRILKAKLLDHFVMTQATGKLTTVTGISTVQSLLLFTFLLNLGFTLTSKRSSLGQLGHLNCAVFLTNHTSQIQNFKI